MITYLTRFAYLPDCTLGFLTLGALRLATLEEPWIPNPAGLGGLPKSGTHDGSCVPDGDYLLDPHNSDAHPNVWALVNAGLAVYHFAVPASQAYGRSAVLIHAGNTTRDTQGCILVGMKHQAGDPGGTIDMVASSQEALRQLQGVLVKGSHKLQIRPYTGTNGSPLFGVTPCLPKPIAT